MEEVQRRATQTLAWVTQAGVDLLSITLDHLTRMGYHRRDAEVAELEAPLAGV